MNGAHLLRRITLHTSAYYEFFGVSHSVDNKKPEQWMFGFQNSFQLGSSSPCLRRVTSYNLDVTGFHTLSAIHVEHVKVRSVGSVGTIEGI